MSASSLMARLGQEKPTQWLIGACSEQIWAKFMASIFHSAFCGSYDIWRYNWLQEGIDGKLGIVPRDIQELFSHASEDSSSTYSFPISICLRSTWGVSRTCWHQGSLSSGQQNLTQHGKTISSPVIFFNGKFINKSWRKITTNQYGNFYVHFLCILQ
jgi:hypothetical protein